MSSDIVIPKDDQAIVATDLTKWFGEGEAHVSGTREDVRDKIIQLIVFELVKQRLIASGSCAPCFYGNVSYTVSRTWQNSRLSFAVQLFR